MSHLQVEVPDPLEGWLLSQRLVPLHASVHSAEGSGWVLDVTAPDAELARILETVRAWLRDEELPSTQVHTGQRVIVVARGPAP